MLLNRKSLNKIKECDVNHYFITFPAYPTLYIKIVKLLGCFNQFSKINSSCIQIEYKIF